MIKTEEYILLSSFDLSIKVSANGGEKVNVSVYYSSVYREKQYKIVIKKGDESGCEVVCKCNKILPKYLFSDTVIDLILSEASNSLEIDRNLAKVAYLDENNEEQQIDLLFCV